MNSVTTYNYGVPSVNPRTLPRWRGGAVELVDRLEPHFRNFLRVYCDARFVMTQETQGRALRAVLDSVDGIRHSLKEAYLGVGMGGSLVRGLGTADTSDVDFFIYASKMVSEHAQRARLRHIARTCERFDCEPCFGAHFYFFVYERQDSPSAVSSVFSTLLVDPEMDSEKMVHYTSLAARRVIREMKERGTNARAELSAAYNEFSGCATRRVVTRFRINIGALLLRYRTVFDGLDDIHVARDLLGEIAEPYIETRRQNFPFPEELERLLVET